MTDVEGASLSAFEKDSPDLGVRVYLMNYAILKNLGFQKKLGQPYVETFKREFKCNRAELLEAALDPEGPTWPAIDCPSLLQGLLAFPLVDLS